MCVSSVILLHEKVHSHKLCSTMHCIYSPILREVQHIASNSIWRNMGIFADSFLAEHNLTRPFHTDVTTLIQEFFLLLIFFCQHNLILTIY